MAKYAVFFLLATALCVGSALAACPEGSNTAITADGKPVCIYCADGSGVTENFGAMTCSCPGGKECLVTIDGKEGTFADYAKTTQESTPEDVASVISEESSSSSSSSSSEETSESSSSTSSSATTSSPESVSDSEAAASSAQLLKGVLVAVLSMVVYAM